MKQSMLPVSQHGGSRATAAPPSEAYSDYDEFSSREGLITHEGLLESYSDAAPNEQMISAPMESPSQGTAILSKRFSQKDLKSSFKRHLPRTSNPLAPDPHALHPPTFHDYQMKVAELESQNAFLKFKLKLQLKDADAAELEYHRAYQAIVEDNSNLHFMNEMLTTEESKIRREAEEVIQTCRRKEAELDAALASNDAMIQEKEDQLQAFLERSMDLIKHSDEKQQREFDERCQEMEQKEQKYLRMIAELDAISSEQEEEHLQKELKLQQKVDELGTTIENLKWGFKLRENELTRDQEIHQANAVELFGANQDLKQRLSDAAAAAYELLASLDKHYQAREEDQDPTEAVNLTVGGVLHLISLLDQEIPSEKTTEESAATAALVSDGTSSAAQQSSEAKPAAPPRRSLPRKLEVVEETSEEDHSTLSVDMTDDSAHQQSHHNLSSHQHHHHPNDVTALLEAEAELEALREQIRAMEEERTAAEAKRAREAAAVEKLLNMVASLQKQHEEEVELESQHEQVIQEQVMTIESLQKQLEEAREAALQSTVTDSQQEQHREFIIQEQTARMEELQRELEDAREALRQQDEDTFAGVNETIADLQEQVSTLEMERQATFDMFKGVEAAYKARIEQLLKRIEMLEKEKQTASEAAELAVRLRQSHSRELVDATVGVTTVSDAGGVHHKPQTKAAVAASTAVSDTAVGGQNNREELESPMMRSVDSTSPVATPPNQVLLTADEDHENNMQLLLNNQSFISNISKDDEEGPLVVEEGDTSFEVSRNVTPIKPTSAHSKTGAAAAAAAAAAVPTAGQLKAQNVTFLEEIVEYPAPRSPERLTPPSARADYDDTAGDTTLNQTSLNNTVLFTTCIQDETPEKQKQQVHQSMPPARSTSSILSANSLEEVSNTSSLQIDTPEQHTAARRWGLDNLSPLGVQHLRRVQSGSDDPDEVPITVEDDSMSEESDDEPYVDRRKLMSSSQLKPAESGFSHHLFDTPGWGTTATTTSSATAAAASTREIVPRVISGSSPSLITTDESSPAAAAETVNPSSVTTDVTAANVPAAVPAPVTPSATASSSKEAVAYEAIINDYQQRVEKLLAQLQNTMDGHTLPDPATVLEQNRRNTPRGSATVATSASSSTAASTDNHWDQKIENIRNAQPPPTAVKLRSREADVSMSAEMIQKYRQELSMDESRDLGDDRFTDREARLNSLLFSPGSFAEEEPSFVVESVGSASDQKKPDGKRNHAASAVATDPVWMFQGASHNANNSFDVNNTTASSAGANGVSGGDMDDSINPDYKNFMAAELRAMGEFLNEGINDVIQQRPDVTPITGTANHNNGGSVGGVGAGGASVKAARNWNNISLDESMMYMFPSPSPDRNHQTIKFQGSEPGSSGIVSGRSTGVASAGAAIDAEGAAEEEGHVNSSVLMNELKLELYFAKDELNKSKMNEKSFHDLNKTLEEEKESLATDLSILSSKHKTTVQSLTSTKAALDSKNKEYSSLQEKMFELLNTVKKLEQENKVILSRSPTSAFN